MQKKVFIYAIFFGLSLGLIGAPVIAEGLGIKEAGKLGLQVGRFWPAWYQLHLGSFSNQSRDEVSKELEGIKDLCRSVNVPSELVNRATKLQTALESLEDRQNLPDQWHWSFGKLDRVRLYGAKTKKVSPAEWELSFTYLYFDDKSDYAKVSFPQKEEGSAFSIQLWLLPGGQEESEATIFRSGNWQLILADEGQLKVKEKTASNSIVTSDSEIPRNIWSHVTVIYDRHELRLLINGESVGQSSSAGDLRLGSDALIGGSYLGAIDELRINRRALKFEQLHYGLPAEYMLLFPLIDWINYEGKEDALWAFHAGLVLERFKAATQLGQLTQSDLKKSLQIFLGETDDLPPPPTDLPSKTTEALSNLEELAQGEWNKTQRKRATEEMEKLYSYLEGS
ncbi:MAG: LamG domain-containing protein [Candidatus Bipolaricaulota bacterium]